MAERQHPQPGSGGGDRSRDSATIVFGRPEITTYLKNGGTLEKTAAMANHTRTTQLYDRRRDEASLDDVERIEI